MELGEKYFYLQKELYNWCKYLYNVYKIALNTNVTFELSKERCKLSIDSSTNPRHNQNAKPKRRLNGLGATYAIGTSIDCLLPGIPGVHMFQMVGHNLINTASQALKTLKKTNYVCTRKFVAQNTSRSYVSGGEP